MIETPCPLPTRLRDRLGAIPPSGFWKLDVRVHGKWDGVLVVNREFNVAGVFIRGRIEPFHFHFTLDDIDDVRAASWFNLLMANYVSRVFGVLFWFPYVSILAINPVLFAFGWMGYSSAYTVAAIGSLISVIVIGYFGRNGYCLTGIPFMAVAVAQIVMCVKWVEI